MKKNKKKIFLAVVLLVAFVSSWSLVLAQYKNQEKIPGAQPTSDFAQYLKDILNFGFAVIGILALFMIVIGAYQYLMAAGNIGKVDSAKETIFSAIFGLILGLCAWIILYKINPDLVKMNLSNISGFGSGTTGTSVSPSSVSGQVPASTQERIAKYDQAVQDAAKKYNVDPNLIRAVIEKESNWNPEAIGKVDPRDKGIMQINERWHPDYFANNDWRNSSSNVDYGTSLLAQGLKTSGGDIAQAAAYFHRGAGNMNDSQGQAYGQDVLQKYYNYQKAGYS